jgi:hypothetical protein
MSGPAGPRIAMFMEPAATVWADVVQLVFNAVGAERALEGADAGKHRGRRQVHVAELSGAVERLVAADCHAVAITLVRVVVP